MKNSSRILLVLLLGLFIYAALQCGYTEYGAFLSIVLVALTLGIWFAKPIVENTGKGDSMAYSLGTKPSPAWLLRLVLWLMFLLLGSTLVSWWLKRDEILQIYNLLSQDGFPLILVLTPEIIITLSRIITKVAVVMLSE